MSNQAFKCTQCNNIQLKGNRCVDDGSDLIVCDLDYENATNQASEMVPSEKKNHDIEFVSQIRMVSQLTIDT